MEQIKITHAAFVASRAIVRLLPSLTLWEALLNANSRNSTVPSQAYRGSSNDLSHWWSLHDDAEAPFLYA